MLNSDFLNEQAFKMSQRLLRERPNALDEQLERGLELVLCRPADVQDIRDLHAFVDELMAYDGLSQEEALEATCLLMLNLNEFMHVN
jgi:hypothetical protein